MQILTHQEHKMNNPIGEMFQRLSMKVVDRDVSTLDVEMPIALEHFEKASRNVCVLCPPSMLGMVLDAMMREILRAYPCLVSADGLGRFEKIQMSELNNKGLKLGKIVLESCISEGTEQFFSRLSSADEAEAFMKKLESQ